MMRKSLLYFIYFFLPLSTFAQLPNGSVAPDFTLQDLDGNTWHLYELLEQGKNVVIDFSATWCGPCWEYHESHALNELYEAYGPDGTDEFMVFFIEGDPDTNLDCLYDLATCDDTSLGDWTAGTLYPIINDDFIAWEYDITYVPTIYLICPDRIVTELGQLQTAEIYQLRYTCAVAVGNNNASIREYVGLLGEYCESVPLNPTVKVQNLGHDPMLSASAELYVNEELRETVLWTGNVATYSTFLLSFDTITLTDDALIRVRITSVNGLADDDSTNNEIGALLMSQDAQDQNLLKLELTTGDLPETVYWEITNSDSFVLYKGGNRTLVGEEYDANLYTTANTTYIIDLPLPGDDCYSFSIYDDLGDGWGVSNYKIIDPHGEVLAEGSDFEYQQNLIAVQNAKNPIANNGAIANIKGLPEEFCRQVEYVFSIGLLNLGMESIHQAEIELLENGNVLDLIEWSGTILPGHTTDIPISPTTIEFGDLQIRIVSINGVADIFSYQNQWQVDLRRNPAQEHVLSLKLQLDEWAFETYWQLSRSNGEVLYSGGNTLVGPTGGASGEANPWDPGAYSASELVEIDLILPDSVQDCYEFLIVDAFGDGLIPDGYLRISERNSGKEIIYKDYAWIPFTTDEIVLDVNPLESSIETLKDVEDIILYPNPAHSEIQINFETKRSLPLKIAVVNMLGEISLQAPETHYAQGNRQMTLDVSSLSPGFYFLNLISGNQQLTRKIAVMRK